MFPAFLMSILQLPWDSCLSPSITLPDIPQKLNDSAGLSEVVLEFRSIFVPQKVLLITLAFDLGLKKNIYTYRHFPKNLSCDFFVQLSGLSGYCLFPHLMKMEEKLLQTEVL